MASPLIPPEDMLCFDVYGLQQSFGRLYAQLLEPLKVTYPQYLVLVLLWEGKPLSVGQIGTRLGLDSSTLTPLLKRMQHAGLVMRTRDAQDERRVLITLTEAGTAMRDRAADIPGCVAAATGLSPDQITSLRAQLADLRRGLQDHVSATTP